MQQDPPDAQSQEQSAVMSSDDASQAERNKLCVASKEDCSFPSCNCQEYLMHAETFESRNRQFLEDISPNENSLSPAE